VADRPQSTAVAVDLAATHIKTRGTTLLQVPVLAPLPCNRREGRDPEDVFLPGDQASGLARVPTRLARSVRLPIADADLDA
jgi:hypothetical protein